MLPAVTLRGVSREDVDRIGWWLDDEEVSSRWFGHYACGEPVHRGYDPAHMLEASEVEWDRVFRHDPRRFIFSIYSEQQEHIGECQLLLDDTGGAELSLLIGRKDLWHGGYGTSTVVALLDQVFSYYQLDRAWVNVPEDNQPASGLFTKLGFLHQQTKEICSRRDGTVLTVHILAIDAAGHRARQMDRNLPVPLSVVTIAELPGSGGDAVGKEIARISMSSFVDEEIPLRMCHRLKRSIGELAALESSRSSLWGRTLRNLEASWAQGAYFDPGYGMELWRNIDHDDPSPYLTADEYREGLKAVIKELALEGSVVLFGNVNHLFIPPDIPAVRVFVTASKASRERRMAEQLGLSLKDAKRRLNQNDRDTSAILKSLFGADLQDMSSYDMVLNLERMSIELAAATVIGVVGVPAYVSSLLQPQVSTPAL